MEIQNTIPSYAPPIIEELSIKVEQGYATSVPEMEFEDIPFLF